MATKANPSASAVSIVASSVMPPSRIRGVESARWNWRGVGEEERLLVGVGTQEAVTDEAEAQPHRCGQGGAELLQRRVAPEEVHRVGQRAAPGELQRIERAVGLEEPGDLDALVEPQAAVDAVGHVELGRHRHVRAGGVAHRAQDGAGEAGAVLDRTAELVVAAVELGAQERAQEVVVPDVHLDAVEAGLHRQRRGAPVVLGDALDAGDVDGTQARAHGREAAGGREGGGAVGARVGHRPGVADLRRRGRALGVHGVGQAAQSRHRVLAEQQAVAVGPPLRRDGQVGHRGEGGPAGRHPAVEVDQLVADLAARRDALEGGRLDDAVAQGQRPEGRRSEDRRDGSTGGRWAAWAYLCRRARRPHVGVRPDGSPVAASEGFEPAGR